MIKDTMDYKTILKPARFEVFMAVNYEEWRLLGCYAM
jgi:hypothetical protein